MLRGNAMETQKSMQIEKKICVKEINTSVVTVNTINITVKAADVRTLI